MAHVNVITAGQLERIRAKVATVSDETRKEEERLRLKTLSEERASKWPNTLQAARARKERARQDRLAAEEAEREEADRQEALVKAEQRRMAIERANKMLFDDTDDVKALHGKLLLSEVLAENQALVQQKKHITSLKKQQEAAFVEQQRKALEAAEAAELAKLQAAKQAALAQKEVQMQQLEQLKARILEERAANKAEGELVRRKAAEEAAELAAKEAAWRQKLLDMNAATKASNDTLLAFRAAERERDKQLEESVEAFCRHKAEVDAQRAAEKAAKEAAKEARRKAMRDMMEENYKRWHQHNEQQLAADVQAAQQKEEENAAAQQRRRQEALAAQHRSNQQQRARKAAAAQADRAADAAFKEAWGQRLALLKQEEQQEAADAREKALQVQRFQQWQSEHKVAKKQAQQLADVQDALMSQLAVQEADERVKEYSQLLLEETAKRGLSTQPVALHVVRAATQRSALTPSM